MEQPKNTTDAKEFGTKAITPEVTWAQRSSKTEAEKNHIFLCIAVPDVDPKKIKMDVQPTQLTFKGFSETKKADYQVTLDLYAEIDPKASKVNHSPRAVEMVLQKKDLDEHFWPRLLKDTKKVHFLKTDFDRWVDEDEQDAMPDDDDYLSRMGGMGGMGDGGFGGIDFSKLGGAGGMGDMGDMGMGMGEGEEDEGDEEDDEDDEDEADEAGAQKTGKIEEVE